jgi:hypothetical protein
MTTRKYSSRSQQTTLAANLTDSATSCTVVSGSALLGGASVSAGTTFTVVIDPDTALEEIVDVTVVSTNVLTITRGVENAGVGQAHSAGAAVRHMAIGRDFREANLHIEATGGYNDGTGAHTMHGIASGEGDVVGTLKTQTLTNKTLTAPTITNPIISGTNVDASIVFEGATPDAFETTLTVVDPTQDNTITLPNTTGTVVIANAAQTLTNKTIDMTGVTLTGLSSAGMSVSSATPKNYVDSILGSATAASTSAASAATSATSAATSATSAAASAATAAASATTSANSATAAATSATSAAASATAAATSATSAAASATTAANSVAAIAGYASAAATSEANAAASASAASTSASSALTSANSAATSASTMSASVTAAATSAASAAASATAAATSATSAAASATAANTSAINAAASESAVAASAAAAATSATSASNSATAAATSAASASTSASSALTSQTAAATSAASASTSASSALTSATSAATSYDEFDDRYLGAKSSPPTVDNDGNALLTGALYWNTVSNKMFVWSGSAWTEISSSADIISYKYTVASGATSVTGADDNGLTLAYTVGKEQVYINGVLQVRGSDYTASTGTSITGMAALTANDIVTVLAFTAFSVSNTYTQAEANALFIPDAIVDAKGDLIVATAADTVARLAAGTNGDTLVADSSATTGLRYNPQNALANPIINGGMDNWQRGTSFSLAASTGTTYVADRWATGTGANQACTISRQATGDTTNLPNIQYALRFQRNSGQTGTGGMSISTSLETVNTIPFAGRTITMSFYARKGANYSPGTFSAYLITGTGTDQNRQSGGYTGDNTSITAAISLTTTWQRFVVTGTIPATATEMAPYLFFDWSGTAGAADYFDITGFQIDLGTYTASTAPAFRRSQGAIQGELAACQRYYYRSKAPSAYSQIGVGPTPPATTSIIYMNITTPVPMRGSVQSVDWGGNMGISDGVNVNTGISSIVPSGGNGGNFGSFATVAITMTSGVLTLYRPYYITDNGAGTTFLGISMEL